MKITQSSIFLNDMRFYAYHGVLPQERVVGGEYSVSLRVYVNLSTAMELDMVEMTLDYSEIYKVIQHEMLTPSDLLEHLAGRLGQAVMDAFPQISEVNLSVVKLNPPMGADCKGAGIELHITRD